VYSATMNTSTKCQPESTARQINECTISAIQSDQGVQSNEIKQTNPNTRRTPRLLQSPYGYVSFRQLTVMKIVDRHSVYVSGIPTQFASVAILSHPHWFGAFGAIIKMRIIQGKAPHEAHIRFEHPHSAMNAILWVNTDMGHMGLSAKNGYQKYCTKFLQRKACNRKNCTLLHEWKPFTEVLNQQKVHQLNPLRRGQIPLEQPQAPSFDLSVTPIPVPAANTAKAQPNPTQNVSPQIEMIQSQISALQHSFDEARLFVDQLMSEVNRLEEQNAALRQENAQRFDVSSNFGHSVPPSLSAEMSLYNSSSSEITGPLMYEVDEIVESVFNDADFDLSE